MITSNSHPCFSLSEALFVFNSLLHKAVTAMCNHSTAAYVTLLSKAPPQRKVEGKRMAKSIHSVIQQRMSHFKAKGKGIAA